MRVIQSFERRLQGAVGNTFARLFGGKVQPAEVADALQREAAEHMSAAGQRRRSHRITTGCASDRPIGKVLAPTK